MKLAALSAGVGRYGQITKQVGIELAACEGSGYLFRIDACEPSAQTAGNHVTGQLIRRNPPERKKWLEAGLSKLLDAVVAHVLQEKVTKCNGVDPLAKRTVACGSHALLVDLIRAGPGQWDYPERKFSGCGLGLKHSLARAVHGNTLELGVECRKQPDDFDAGLLTQNVEGPRAVFAAAPGEKNALHGFMVQVAQREGPPQRSDGPLRHHAQLSSA